MATDPTAQTPSDSTGRPRGPIRALAAVYDRMYFPPVEQMDAHLRKIDIFRIVVGFTAAYRFGEILLASRFYFDDGWTIPLLDKAIPVETVIALGVVIVLWMVTLGLFTPVAVIVALLTVRLADNRLATATLGTDVLQIALMFLLVAGAGRTLSLDSLLARRAPRPIAQLVRIPHALSGPLTRERIAAGYIILFGTYAIIHMAALTFHFNDEYWLHGRTVEVMLTNSYMSKTWPVVRALQDFWPLGVHLFSAAAVAMQTVYQTAMIPLMFFKWGARYVLAFGLLFFLLSMTGLNLSYLALIEIPIWLVLFVPAPLPDRFLSRARALAPRIGRALQRLAPSHAVAVSRSGVPGVLSTLIVIWIVLLAAFVTTWGPVRALEAKVGVTEPPVPFTELQTKLRLLGIESPNVFNWVDLSMGNRWPVMCRKVGERRVMVPFNGLNGERMQHHDADILYFGNSLPWRRAMLGQPPGYKVTKHDRFWCLLYQVARYDARLNSLRKTQRYEVDLWGNAASKTSVPLDQRYVPRKLQQLTIDVRVNTQQLPDECYAF